MKTAKLITLPVDISAREALRKVLNCEGEFYSDKFDVERRIYVKQITEDLKKITEVWDYCYKMAPGSKYRYYGKDCPELPSWFPSLESIEKDWIFIAWE